MEASEAPQKIKVVAQYIDKNALVAEIRKRLLPVIRDKYYDEWEEGQDSECIAILNIIDTLEMKEVDLEKEIELIKGDYEQVDVAWNNDFDFIAKHFFELGLKAQKNVTNQR